MDDLEDELDLRYYRGVKPDVDYRVHTTEVHCLPGLQVLWLRCS